MSGLRNSLKAATTEAHARAEARWTDAGRFANRAGYDAWLARMWAVHDGLGRGAAGSAGWEPGTALEDARSAALRADIGSAPDRASHAPKMSCDEAWGALYALNGSALGAGHLLRGGMAEAHWPVAYLTEMAGYARSGALAGFFRELDASDAQEDAAIAGAMSVFQAIAAPHSAQPAAP